MGLFKLIKEYQDRRLRERCVKYSCSYDDAVKCYKFISKGTIITDLPILPRFRKREKQQG